MGSDRNQTVPGTNVFKLTGIEIVDLLARAISTPLPDTKLIQVSTDWCVVTKDGKPTYAVASEYLPTVTHPRDLISYARDAAARAYCPYSKFRVGAAVRCKDGAVVLGCNIENASYGLTVCAERVALWSALALGKEPVTLAVSCIDAQKSDPHESVMPCGACRQTMAEFLPNGAEIIIDNVGPLTLGMLLPSPFRLPTHDGKEPDAG